MKMFTLMMVLFSASVFGADYERKTDRFTISTIAPDGNLVFYNCDSVENRVERVLEEMGAIVHSVRCRGGLDPWNGFNLPASVTVVYDVLNSEIDGNVATQMMDSSISQRTNCHLNHEIFDAVKANFEIDKYTKARCRRASGRTRVRVVVLKAI